MIQQLSIKNFITINTLELNCYEGLTVFTGESGAGKSILFSVLNCLLGKQTKSDCIGPFADFAECEGVFSVSHLQHHSLINSLTEGEDTLIIYRKFDKKKSPIIKINGQRATQKTLKSVGNFLAIVISQHEQLSLLKENTQLNLIDTTIQKTLGPNLEEYRQIYKHYKEIEKELLNLESLQDNKESQLDYLQFQITDIRQQEFKADEDSILNNEKKAITRSQQYSKAIQDSTDQSSKALAELQAAIQSLEQCQALQENNPEEIQVLEKKLKDSLPYLEDINYQSQKCAQALSSPLSDSEINAIEERLDTIFRYSHKYKCSSLNALIALTNELENRANRISKAQENIDTLREEKKNLEQSLTQLAERLTKTRTEGCKITTKKIEKLLKKLGFDYVDFNIKISNSGNFSDKGCDQIDFLLSVNAGSQAKSLSAVSSGGELSRILLAFYSLFSQTEEQDLILFDEIDTGVGGMTAHAMGEQLSVISKSKQLFCITHLAQIARHAHQHVVISKSIENKLTSSQLTILNENSKKEELERMVGGQELLFSLK